MPPSWPLGSRTLENQNRARDGDQYQGDGPAIRAFAEQRHGEQDDDDRLDGPDENCQAGADRHQTYESKGIAKGRVQCTEGNEATEVARQLDPRTEPES